MSRYLVWLTAVLLLVGMTPDLFAQDEMGAAEDAAPAAEAMAEEAVAEEPVMSDEPLVADEPEYFEELGEDYEEASSDFLESTSEFLDDNSVFGVIRMRFDIGADLIHDSNIFLNDEDERGTQGVVDDFILRLNAGIAAEMKVNSRYTKVFNRDRVTLIRFDYSWNKYFDNDEITNSGWSINSDIFGFLSDLLSARGGKGKGLYYRLKLDYSRLTDPLDLIIREAFTAGFPIVDQVEDLRRTEATLNLELGWLGNGWDVAIGYDFYRLEFDNDSFEQAENDQHTAWGEFGLEVMARTRAYLRGEWQRVEFPAELLNDADVTSVVLGLEGVIMSDKIRYDINGGIMNWDATDNGLIGDTDDYEGGIFAGTIVYRPLEERKLSFQLDASRDVDWSAISNYRIDDRVRFSIMDDLMPDRLSYDVSLQLSHHEQSLGPRWDRIEAGAGLTWTPHTQLSFTLRYLYRDQDSDEDYEIVNVQASQAANETIGTNGNFVQHVVSLGCEIRF